MLIARVCIVGAAFSFLAHAQSLTIINPNFSATIKCSVGYAYETWGGGCDAQYPQQDFNSVPGIGWRFDPLKTAQIHSDGITGPNSGFNPPSFTGLPFTQAAILQGNIAKVQQL